MEKAGKFWQGTKIRKRILFVVLILGIISLLVCTLEIAQIQLYSIWSESSIKSLNQYDMVLMHQNGWWGGIAKPLDQKDLVRLYFILGSTREYQAEKHQKYLPDGKILKRPYIVFCYDEQHSNNAASYINWEYENNTLIVYKDDDDRIKAKRYYIDQKNAESLHELFDKYGV